MPLIFFTYFTSLYNLKGAKLHGIPKTIVFDWDPTFTSAFWNELFSLHPQSDGQTEIVNKCLE